MRLEDLDSKIDTIITLTTHTSARLDNIEDNLSKKVDREELQQLDERVRLTESFTSRVKGAIGVLGLAWTALLTWVGMKS